MTGMSSARLGALSLLAFVALTLGCESKPPSAPTTTTTAPPIALTVAGLSPNTGTPAGGTVVTMTGSGFRSDTIVTFDGTAAKVTFLNSEYIMVTTPSKAAGPVDVVATNPDGQSGRLSGAFTYTVFPPPSVTGVSENVGSTRGGAALTVTGAGFRTGAVVTFGGTTVHNYVFKPTTIIATAPAHPAGTVDVVVTNPDGQSSTLAGGYTYEPPESFEVNGQWTGGADSNYGTSFRFTVQANTVVSVSCGTSPDVALSPPPPIVNGEFSFAGDDGVRISGSIVSPDVAMGTIRIPGVQFCFGEPWYAERDTVTADPHRQVASFKIPTAVAASRSGGNAP